MLKSLLNQNAIIKSITISKRFIPSQIQIKYLKMKDINANDDNPIPITVKLRSYDHSGSRKSRNMRKYGSVPGVLYGKETDNTVFKQLISFDKKELIKELRIRGTSLENILYNVQVVDNEGSIVTNKIAIIRQIQINTITGEPFSANLLIYRPGRILALPVEFVNDDANENSKFGYLIHDINNFVNCICESNIPRKLTVDVSTLKKNGVIRAEDLILPPGVQLDKKFDPKLVLCVYKIPK
mmetsp:Transcript_16449/g.14831  ORF Transcript_16449/g.14831 Transcript_16449/m.14831 type:complete len:240 (+) Transcript_16449:69-788(+)